MWEWLVDIFGRGFMPHGHCYLWSPTMVWAQVGSNFAIGAAYASIAATLAVLVRRIRDIPFAWAYVAFGVFILSCGLTHWIDIVTVWYPIYWLDAAVRILTALASVITAIMILPMVPRASDFAEAARLSNERRDHLVVAHAELEVALQRLAQSEKDALSRAKLSEEQFESLVESMPQLAWISAPDGANLYRNSRWTEYSGVALDELQRNGWESLHDPLAVDEVVRKWQAALASGTIFDVECRLRSAAGEYRWFVARAVPLRSKEGGITRWVGTLTDIHEQRTTRDEALRNVRMKDEFLATVSHELRTPLNAMLGWSRMLRTRSLPDDKREKALETIERNAVAQAQLIDDLLDISRIVSGKMRLDVVPVDPANAVEAAIEAVRPAAAAKNIRLPCTLDPHAGPVSADAGRLQQIVWNLVSNAIKFTPNGGRVNVTLSRVHSHIEISISDTGIGIGSEFLPRVFERFSQEDGSMQRTQGGLGLGLAIVKHLVELHGGTVSVHSDGPGKGSTFVVYLPLAAVKAAELARPTSPAAVITASGELEKPLELRGLRVLLVEDEADSRELVTTVLESCGVVVSTATNAEEGLRTLRGAPFDVIVSDIGLPGSDGYAFIRAVRETSAFMKVPAAAMTAYARAEDRRRALSEGFQMHVPKPVEPAELIAVVANLARIAAAMKS